MLISPPFLINSIEISETLNAGLQPVAERDATTMAPEGNYPISQSVMWHTGIHLQAPKVGVGHAQVRAIADGTIIFVNPARARVDDPSDGQAYNPFGTGASWTDNGMIIMEHKTEIGADGDTATVVKFYSSYMHLSHIDTAVTVGKKIYRKDVLGKPGSIYDHAEQIELSISCDDDNLQKLIGRKPEWQEPQSAPTKDGRTDAIFGDIYVYLPASTPIRSATSKPTSHLRSTYHGTEILGTAQWVKINYSTTPGTCILSSYNTAGKKIGDCAPEIGFEYNLYTEATARHASHPSGANSSSASAWYELLRFGRNIGRGPNVADKDPLPADAIHWRKIRTVAGNDVWADLNAPGSYKFSDADFLPVIGWNCYHDDHQLTDQRCDSDKLKSLIADPHDPNSKSDNEKLAQRIGSQDVFPKLARTICKFPNEWDKATLETRYKFMSERPDIRENPDSWTKARKHLEALGIDGLPEEFKNANWHFHPAEFIRHFSKCGWLNGTELAQCFPRTYLQLDNTQFIASTVTWQTASTRASRWALPFNKATRKYGIAHTKQRLLHFFAHVIPETDFLKLMKEGDNAAGTYLIGKPYYPYYGRGLIQLTFRKTYEKYGDFRRFAHTIQTGPFHALGWNPDTMIAFNNTNYNAVNCADSACYFVASCAGMMKKMDHGIAQADAIAVSKCVNGDVAIEKLNGLDIRLQCVLFLRDALLDRPSDAPAETMSFNWRRSSRQEQTDQLDAHGHHIKKFFLKESPWVIQVHLDKQRP